MNTGQTLRIESTSLDSTLKLAARIGRKLRGSEVIELVSDLGGGKTAFVQGLAAGMGSDDKVHSPSFTISNQYQAGDLTLYHFDFHRLDEAGIMRDELVEIVGDGTNVVAIEWAGIIKDVLPSERVTINIKTTGENTRQISFEYPKSLKYLIPANT